MTTLSTTRGAPGMRRGLLERSLTHLDGGTTISASTAVISGYTASPVKAREAEPERDSPSRRNPSDGPLLYCRTEPLPQATSIGHGVTARRDAVARVARRAGGRLPLGMGRRDLSHFTSHFTPSVGVLK